MAPSRALLATTSAELQVLGLGRFAYRVLNLMPASQGQALIVQVPDDESAARLRASGLRSDL